MVFAKTSMPSATGFAFPDVCNTYVGVSLVPVPYPNTSTAISAVPSQVKCFIQAMPEHNLLTTTPVSNGDEAGYTLGVASGTIIGPSRELVGSVKVFTGTAPASKMLSPTLQNSTNAPGAQIAPAQVKVMLIS